MYQLSSSSAFVLVVIFDIVDETAMSPSLQICATNKLRHLHKSRACENLSLPNAKMQLGGADQLRCRTG